MRLSRKLMATAAVLLVSAGAAVAATSAPSGTYSGDIHWNSPGQGKETFTVTATLDKGKLTSLQGQGNPGFVPYNPKLSNATAGCGDANSWQSSSKAKISGQVTQKGLFAFVVKDQYHVKVTLKGHFVSGTEAKARFRFYQSHLPYFNKKTGKSSATGHCDSGQLKVVLTKGS